MLGQIVRYELRQQLRSKQFWFIAAVFGGLGFVLMHYSGELMGGGNINVNSPHNIQLFTAASTLFGLFLVASMVAPSVSRDFELNSWQVMFSCPVRWRIYLLGRFIGSFLAALLSFNFVNLGYLVGAHGPFVKETIAIGPFEWAPYLYASLVFGVVNLLVMAALLFALSSLLRRALYAYVGALFLFILWSLSYEVLNDERLEGIVWIFDAVGFSSYELVTRLWTPFELDSRLIPLEGDFLLNRVLWLLISAGLLGLTLWRFNPYPRTARGRKRVVDDPAVRAVHRIPTAEQVFHRGTAWAQLRRRTTFEIRRVFGSVPLLVVLAFGVWNAIANARLVDPVFGSPVLPLTRVLVNALGLTSTLLLIIVVTFYSAELIWRERQAYVDQIVDSLPAPNWVFFCSKLFAMWCVIGAVLAISSAALIVYQLLAGTPIVPGLYLQELGFRALPFFWIAVLAFLFQVLSPNKYLGMLFMTIYLGLSLAGSIIFDASSFIVFGSHPTSEVSGLASQGFRRLESLGYDAYWAALSLSLAVISYLLWRRGTDEGLKLRVRRARDTVRRWQLATVAIGLLACGSIGFALYREDVTGNPIPPSDNRSEVWQVRYEEVARPLENQPTPVIRRVELNFDTEIATLSARSHGEVVIENRHDQPFDEVLVGMPMLAREAMLSVEGAEVEEEYPRIRYSRYRFQPPMQPGERRSVTFDLDLDFSHYPGGQVNGRLETSGTALFLGEVMPDLFGYNPFSALADPAKRREYGLPPDRAHIATLEEDWGRRYNALFGASNNIDFEGTYSVDRGQVAFLGGELVRSWEEGDRAFFHYKSETPISLALTIQQGEYATLRGRAGDVAIAVHHHPADDYHVRRFLEHFEAAVPYYSREFGHFPYREFRLIQRAYGIGANANSGQLTFGEFAGFTSDLTRDTSVDWGTHVIGHEAGHNWWGIMVTSAKAEGSHMLQETLAQYAGLMLLEKTYDRGMVGRFLRHSLRQYHTDRNLSSFVEVPLYRSRQETDYVHYWKGAPIIYGIKEMIGEEAMNRALRLYFEEWAFSTDGYPTTLDFLRHLRAQTPAEYQATITDGFQRILMHDLSVTEAGVEPTGDGRYRVTATLRTRKLERTPEGEETPVAIHEPIQIVVVDREIERSDRYNARLLADERHWIDDEETVVTFLVDEEPAAVIVDPFHNFIERNVDDNVKRLAS